MEIPETHYARTIDGLNIAYQVLGEGPSDLVWCLPFISNIEALWALPEFAAFSRGLSRFSRLILFDPRGADARPGRCRAAGQAAAQGVDGDPHGGASRSRA